MPANYATRSPRVNKSFCRNTGTRERSTRFVYPASYFVSFSLFLQDADILKRHDFTEATESTMDVSMLPKVMQVKNFGKRSRTKYTHLLDQDTTVAAGGFGGTAPVKSGGMSLDGGGCFLCGGPHLKKGL